MEQGTEQSAPGLLHPVLPDRGHECCPSSGKSVDDDDSVARWALAFSFSETQLEGLGSQDSHSDGRVPSQLDSQHSQASCDSTVALPQESHAFEARPTLSAATTTGRLASVASAPLPRHCGWTATAPPAAARCAAVDAAAAGCSSLVARRGRLAATMCVDTDLCAFAAPEQPVVHSCSGAAVAACGGDATVGAEVAVDACTRCRGASCGCSSACGAEERAPCAEQQEEPCAGPESAVGWFCRCRGCAQLTGGELCLQSECVPFCAPCAARLQEVPRSQRAGCETQLLHIHNSWAHSGH
eukprot:354770-Chlamydomonas_euryale.AAC.4